MPEFPKAEYDSRVKRLGKLMRRDKLDLVLVSGDENFRYFTGARSLASWRSYTRPVFAILDGENPPVALVHASLEETTRAEGYYSKVHAYQDMQGRAVQKYSSEGLAFAIQAWFYEAVARTPATPPSVGAGTPMGNVWQAALSEIRDGRAANVGVVALHGLKITSALKPFHSAGTSWRCRMTEVGVKLSTVQVSSVPSVRR